MHPCRDVRGRPTRPIVWSRRNGPWARVPVLWIGAAPGNAGGKGTGRLGAHGTRIPFGGDIAGSNLELLLGSIGLSRNETFITAAYNCLPSKGGGEPTAAELRTPVGHYASSIALLRDTVVATGARLIVALGNVALRTLAGAVTSARADLPGLTRLERNGLVRGRLARAELLGGPDPVFSDAWRDAWGEEPVPAILWLTHPSGQNMSPFARPHTQFHRRMREARTALRRAARAQLGIVPPRRRAELPSTGVYALPEWRDDIAPRFMRLDRLWRAHGL